MKVMGLPRASSPRMRRIDGGKDIVTWNGRDFKHFMAQNILFASHLLPKWKCQLVDAGACRRAVIIWVKTLHSKIKRSILAIYTGIIRSTEIRIHASPPFTNMSSSAIYSKSLARICTHGSSSHRHGKKWNEYPTLNIIKAKGYEEMHKAWTL